MDGACLFDCRGYNSLGSGGSGKQANGPISIQSEYAYLYAFRTYSSTSKPFPVQIGTVRNTFIKKLQ